MEIEQKAIHEWQRQNEIFQQAQRSGIDSVMMACLAAMNAIVKILGYTPEEAGYKIGE